MAKFCALCGKTSGRFIENLCLPCYFRREIDHASFNVKALVCPLCLRYRVKGKWFEPTSKLLREVVKEIIENFVKAPLHSELAGTVTFETQLGEHPSIREGSNRFVLSVIYKESELTLEEKTTVLFNLKFEKCPTCARIKKEPKEAILQFRSFDGKIDAGTRKKILSIIEESARLKNVSYKVEEKKTGFDVKFSSQGFARSLAHKLKDILDADATETFKLKSVRDGKKGVLSIA
ncbi:MAG: NMD3-related protein, partial [Candidatus Jordarchaeales archaeon]